MGYTEVEVVRHGFAEHMETPEIIAGWAPHSMLTGEGIQQAEALGEAWKCENTTFDIAYSSPIIRAIDTLRIAQSIAGIAVHAKSDPGFAEHCLGAHEGKLREQTYTPYLQWLISLQGALFRHQGKNSVGISGESSLQVCQRTVASVQSIHRQAAGERLTAVVASHQIAIKSLVSYVEMGGQHGPIDPFELKNRIVDRELNPIGPCSRTLLIVEDSSTDGSPLIKVEYVGRTVNI